MVCTGVINWKRCVSHPNRRLEGATPEDRLAHHTDNVLLLHNAIHRQGLTQRTPFYRLWCWKRNLTKEQYAAVMGLNKDLKLKGNNFTNAATAFFIAYLIAEVPNGTFPHPVPARSRIERSILNQSQKASSSKSFPSQNGSPPMSSSGASQQPAPLQPTTIAPCSRRASSSASSKPPSHPR